MTRYYKLGWRTSILVELFRSLPSASYSERSSSLRICSPAAVHEADGHASSQVNILVKMTRWHVGYFCMTALYRMALEDGTPS